MKKLILAAVFSLGVFFVTAPSTSAQFLRVPSQTLATDSAKIASDSSDIASISAEEKRKLEELKKEDITKPEETEDKQELVALFAKRPVNDLSPFNFMAYSVQRAVQIGVPANTAVLIFLLPFLATLFVFIRQIIGLPSLEMWVPIALSITLVSTGITAGIILLITILLASVVARMILKKIRVMQLSKMALSVLVVSLSVFISLSLSATGGILTVKQLSIFPILLLILMSEKIVTLQLTRSTRETLAITGVTILLGIIGFFILSSEVIRHYILLYPELILLLIPINILIGRYFGLRLTEYFRFSTLRKYAN